MTELNEKMNQAWQGFAAGEWQTSVNVRDFIQKNYTPYEGDEAFLSNATDATTTLWDKVMEGIKIETGPMHRSILIRIWLQQLLPTTQAISTSHWKKLSVCKRKRP